MSASAPSPGRARCEPNHGLRIFGIWVVATIVLEIFVIFIAGPHIPPFQMSLQSSTQHEVNVTLLALAAPVAAMIWCYFALRDRRLPQ